MSTRNTYKIDDMTYEEKVPNSERIIIEALQKGMNPLVTFSGGKDSIVVLHLVRKFRPDMLGLFANTGVEHPETIEFIRSIPNIIQIRGKATFWQCVDEYGWPIQKNKAKVRGNMCCKVLKEDPLDEFQDSNKVDLVFDGLTGAESRQRWMTLLRMGPLYKRVRDQRWVCHPIYNWTDEDVWRYIAEERIPYNTLYDKGAVRCGCAPCTAYLSWHEELKKLNPKLYYRVMVLRRRAELEDEDIHLCGENCEVVLTEEDVKKSLE